MTVEEYAAACDALPNQFGLINLSGTADLYSLYSQQIAQEIADIEYSLAEAERWNPPVELQASHEVLVEFGEFYLKFIAETGLLDLIQDLEEAYEEKDTAKVLELEGEIARYGDKQLVLWNKLTEVEAEYDRIVRDFSPATLELLSNADCL